MVCPRLDRRDDLLRLGGREHELQVRRRLLDQLEQVVEPLPGNHVSLVDDVYLEPPGDRGVEGPFAQVPCVVHATMRGRVNLDHVDAAGPGRGQRDTGLAYPAWVGGGTLEAVERRGNDQGNRLL